MKSIQRYKFERDCQTLTINGIRYDREELLNQKPISGCCPALGKELKTFLADWYGESPYMSVQTSGSTGIPKRMEISKDGMMRSAALTCSFLDLKEGDTSLLCLPLQYIAGKMMVVRALIASLDLQIVNNSGNPLKECKTGISFAAMIPLQVYNSLQNPEEKERLRKIDTLIIGGGSIDRSLEKELKDFPGRIFSTYGMTETLSHIALRRINGRESSSFYIPFDTVKLSLSEENTLIIEAPQVCDSVLITNDIAEINSDGTFLIKGRKDNVIISGGIKIQIEELERKLETYLHFPFAFTGIPHPKFGEELVLLISKPAVYEFNRIKIEEVFPPYYQPKKIIPVSEIPMTGNGKKDRSAIRKIACSAQ